MTKIRTIAPTVLAVSVAAARDALRIDGTDLDAQITIWLKGVIADLEHQIGQCMMEQGWSIVLDAFPPTCTGTEISLPHPVISITSVKYFDPAGVEQTLSASAYSLNRERYRTTLTPVAGTSWPPTVVKRGAVTVAAVCGYGSTDASTPENVQLYILAKLVEQFDPAARLERDTVQSAFVDGLLDACRSYG